jgi:hypothetical protein
MVEVLVFCDMVFGLKAVSSRDFFAYFLDKRKYVPKMCP